MQLARAYCAIANGGRLVTPTLVRKIVQGERVLLDNTTKERVEKFPRVMPKFVADRV